MKGDKPMKLIENNILKIIDLCKKHKVHKLFVFGSVLTNHFNDKFAVRTDYQEPIFEEECRYN